MTSSFNSKELTVLELDIEQLENNLEYMYLDTLGLPTTGLGFLLGTKTSLTVDSLALPWRDHRSDRWVNEARVRAEFKTLAALKLEKQGGTAYAKHVTIYLSKADRAEIFKTRIGDYERTLRETLGVRTVGGHTWDQYEVPAHFGLIEMAWNLGPNFLGSPAWPYFTRAARDMDYRYMARHAHIENEERRSAIARIYFYMAYALKNLKRTVGYRYTDAQVEMPWIRNALDGIYNPVTHPIGFWFQVMLHEAGFYSASKLDGKFGPATHYSWETFLNTEKKLRSRGNLQEQLTVLRSLSNQAIKIS